MDFFHNTYQIFTLYFLNVLQFYLAPIFNKARKKLVGFLTYFKGGQLAVVYYSELVTFNDVQILIIGSGSLCKLALLCF